MIHPYFSFYLRITSLFLLLHWTAVAVIAQTIANVNNPRYQIAHTFCEALKNNKFNQIEPYVVSKAQIQASFEQQSRSISTKKAKKLRKQLLQEFRHQFKQTRQQAIQQGIDWKKVTFVNCEYNNRQLYNLRFFFTHQQQTYWIALEVYQYNFSNQFFLRENIYSQFEKQLAQLPYQSTDNTIPDSLFLPPIGNIDSLYTLVDQQNQQTNTTELTDLIANTDVLLDSLVQEINTFPLASAQTSIIKELMLAQGNAAKLKGHFAALNQFVSAEFSTTTLAKDEFHLIEIGQENWGEYLFDGRTIIATKVLLLKWKKDLKYFESRVLSLWLKK